MSKRVVYIIIFLFTVNNSHADVPVEIVKKFRLIVKLIQENKPAELSKMVSYPLTRENPLPDIMTAKQFIAYYPTLIDEAFKNRIKLYNDSDIFEHHGSYGLVGGPFNGDIWVDENGKLQSINYSSDKETALKNHLTKEIQAHIYPSVNTWDDNIIVCKSKTLLIRVDNTKKGIRYVSWCNGHKDSERPDLVLFNGVEEAQGTMGGWTWTFKNGDWTYVVDDVEMCENDKGCGYYLRLFFKDTMKRSIKLQEIK